VGDVGGVRCMLDLCVCVRARAYVYNVGNSYRVYNVGIRDL
jgi:hypothetical protein